MPSTYGRSNRHNQSTYSHLNYDEVVDTMPCPYILSEHVSYEGKNALVVFPNGFLVSFPPKQGSQRGESISMSWPNRLSLASMFILSYPL